MSNLSYDALWNTVWGDMQRFGPVHRHTMEDLVRTVSALEVSSILDVGCGSGENLAALASLGRYGLTGTDISQAALRLAQQRVPSARVLQLDIEKGALTEKFDLVMSIQVVEHILDDMAAFRNIASMARRYVFISTMQGRMRRSEIAIGHVRNYSAIELRRKIESVGLEVLQVYGWGFPFYSPIYRSLVQLVPGGSPSGRMGPVTRFGAHMLYQLYRFNWPGRGDVISALARIAK